MMRLGHCVTTAQNADGAAGLEHVQAWPCPLPLWSNM
jgi:hypothetical protein